MQVLKKKDVKGVNIATYEGFQSCKINSVKMVREENNPFIREAASRCSIFVMHIQDMRAEFPYAWSLCLKL